MKLKHNQLESLTVMLSDLREYYFADFEVASMRNKLYISERLKDMAQIELLVNIELEKSGDA